MQFQHYTALMLQAIPGGYVKGDRVRSLIDYKDSNGHLKQGDIGTVRVRHPRCSKQLSSTLSLSLSLSIQCHQGQCAASSYGIISFFDP